MKADTNVLQGVANQIVAYLANYTFDKPSLQNRHTLIQYKLSNLSTYFTQSAAIVNQVESNLTTSFNAGVFNFSHKENWNAISQMQKKDVSSTVSVTLQATYAQASATFSSTYVSAGGKLNVGDVKGTGKCSVSLWKDKEFDPSVKLEAGLSASLLSTNVNAKIGTNDIYAYGSVDGMAGVVYANSKAVLSFDEQSLNLGIGAAALKGSCTFSFHIFGATIELTGTGALGSFEANLSYSHKSREWEFGSKLGFIAGLGFDVKVSY